MRETAYVAQQENCRFIATGKSRLLLCRSLPPFILLFKEFNFSLSSLALFVDTHSYNLSSLSLMLIFSLFHVGTPTKIRTNIMIRSMGPVSEKAMVSALLHCQPPFID
jgi:hypothetical protein